MTEELKEIGLDVGHPAARQWFVYKPGEGPWWEIAAPERHIRG
jgi:hypothetical protein